MNYLGLGALLLALIWSWFAPPQKSSSELELHASIQSKVVEIIENAVRKKHPETDEVRILRIWTEALSQEKIKASFKYELSGPPDETVSGNAFVHKTSENSWSIRDVHLDRQDIHFKKDFTVRSE